MQWRMHARLEIRVKYGVKNGNLLLIIAIAGHNVNLEFFYFSALVNAITLRSGGVRSIETYLSVNYPPSVQHLHVARLRASVVVLNSEFALAPAFLKSSLWLLILHTN